MKIQNGLHQVLLADTENYVYEVSETGAISEFKGSRKSENIRYFLDKLKDHSVNLVGTQDPKPFDGLHEKAQWLSGIAAGAWFELHKTEDAAEYHFKRISPHGNIDVHEKFIVDDDAFDYDLEFEFIHYSNCKFFHVKQGEKVFRFERKV